MKIIRNIYRFALVIAVLAMSATGCDDPYKSIDYSKLEAEEAALLEEYLDQELENMVNAAIDTIHKKDSRLIYFEMEKGTGDSILPGNIVGFRYTYYELARNDDGEPTLYPWYSNVSDEEPFYYQVGSPTGVAMTGIDEGIKYMRHLGKSKMIIPSDIGSKNYFTVIADVEVTYLVNR
jgi:FKBP-type peptidyl-prolyl cis-trans isomerase